MDERIASAAVYHFRFRGRIGGRVEGGWRVRIAGGEWRVRSDIGGGENGRGWGGAVVGGSGRWEGR